MLTEVHKLVLALVENQSGLLLQVAEASPEGSTSTEQLANGIAVEHVRRSKHLLG